MDWSDTLVEAKEVRYRVDMELWVNPTRVEKLENPSLITAVEIPSVRISREIISDENVL